ncbi:MAG: TolC family protein [Pirellulales bacterium]|nr:TolC family protein [Pirellulales bacterium]
MKLLCVVGLGCTVLLTITLCPAPIRAQGKALTIDDAVTAALTHSALVQEIEATFVRQKAEAFETRTLANPEFGTELAVPSSFEHSRGRNEITVNLVQPVKLTHGTVRNRLATLIDMAGSSERERALLELAARVRIAFARTWVLSERRNAFATLIPRAQALDRFVTAGLRVGAYGKGEDALFRAEVFKAEAELKGLTAESIAGLSELSRVSGYSFADTSLAAPTLPVVPAADQLKVRFERSETKVQERSKILLDLARAAKEVARGDAYPEFRPRIFFSRSNDGVDLVGLGVSFDLPFWSRNTADRMRADATFATARANHLLIDTENFKISILETARSYSIRREEILLYQQHILPLVRRALEATELQVRSGTGSIFQLWQTLREYADANQHYLELWTKAFTAHVELSVLLGEEI